MSSSALHWAGYNTHRSALRSRAPEGAVVMIDQGDLVWFVINKYQ
jgi:hypothetical protein